MVEWALCIKSNFFCFIPLAFKAEITDLCAKFKCLYSFIVICTFHFEKMYISFCGLYLAKFFYIIIGLL